MFNLTEPSEVSFKVYDVAGRSVASRDAGLLERGFHKLSLSEGLTGNEVSPGIYFYSIRCGTGVANGKVIVLR